MKQQIINWLTNDRSFFTGLALYHQYGISKSFKAALNRQGNTKYNFEVLCDQLRQLACISPAEFNAIMSKPVIKASLNVPETQSTKVDRSLEKLLSSDINTLSYDELKAWARQYEVKAENNKKSSLIAALEIFVKNKLQEQASQAEKQALTLEVKKAIRLREEFPFLKEKECPDELKILVADMLTAYDKFREAHPRMFEAGSEEELQKAVSDVVENYLENQAIWKELNYYKEHGEILGEHPIFNQQEVKDPASLSTEELVKIKDNLEHSIWRNQKLIDEGKKPHLNKERTDRINKYREELDAIEVALKNR